MSIDLSLLEHEPRLLFEIPLRPVQGRRFQPTGFPGLGHATFQTSEGTSLLVESAQSTANRLESTCWDRATQDLRPELQGISHVRVERNGVFLTDSILEAHRLNSPYLLKGKDRTIFDRLKKEVGGVEPGPIDHRRLAEVLLNLDIGALIHGVFLPQPELANGRLRVARAMSAFIEADGAQVAASGGVKNDHVNPRGVAKDGFGHVPFARDEFTAERITLYVNIDLGQIRGYGLGADVERLLTLLSLYKLRRLLDSSLRLRTACDFEVSDSTVAARRPKGFSLPDADALCVALKPAIAACASRMTVTTVTFNDELKVGKSTDREESELVEDANSAG